MLFGLAGAVSLRLGRIDRKWDFDPAREIWPNRLYTDSKMGALYIH